MAHKKGVGSTDNGRDSISKRLGVKLFGGQYAIPGNIIVRQRGTKFHAGLNVGIGKDHTLFALKEGFVTFTKKQKNRTFVSVEPSHIVTDEVVEGTVGSQDEKDNVVKEAPKAAPKPLTSNADTEVGTTTENTNKKTAPAQKAKTTQKGTEKKEDLTKVEGIGPKTKEVFNNKGIFTFAQLAAQSPETLKSYLSEAGSNYEHMDPSSWPQQAQLLAEGKLKELKAWQDKLDGGRITEEE